MLLLNCILQAIAALYLIVTLVPTLSLDVYQPWNSSPGTPHLHSYTPAYPPATSAPEPPTNMHSVDIVLVIMVPEVNPMEPELSCLPLIPPAVEPYTGPPPPRMSGSLNAILGLLIGILIGGVGPAHARRLAGALQRRDRDDVDDIPHHNMTPATDTLATSDEFGALSISRGEEVFAHFAIPVAPALVCLHADAGTPDQRPIDTESAPCIEVLEHNTQVVLDATPAAIPDIDEILESAEELTVNGARSPASVTEEDTVVNAACTPLPAVEETVTDIEHSSPHFTCLGGQVETDLDSSQTSVQTIICAAQPGSFLPSPQSCPAPVAISDISESSKESVMVHSRTPPSDTYGFHLHINRCAALTPSFFSEKATVVIPDDEPPTELKDNLNSTKPIDHDDESSLAVTMNDVPAHPRGDDGRADWPAASLVLPGISPDLHNSETTIFTFILTEPDGTISEHNGDGKNPILKPESSPMPDTNHLTPSSKTRSSRRNILLHTTAVEPPTPLLTPSNYSEEGLATTIRKDTLPHTTAIGPPVILVAPSNHSKDLATTRCLSCEDTLLHTTAVGLPTSLLAPSMHSLDVPNLDMTPQGIAPNLKAQLEEALNSRSQAASMNVIYDTIIKRRDESWDRQSAADDTRLLMFRDVVERRLPVKPGAIAALQREYKAIQDDLLSQKEALLSAKPLFEKAWSEKLEGIISEKRYLAEM
ncbi:hypothetical protein K439DRAFT_1615104 [Ramaria rubella]|nr:hypothetical protein K439DRAFT_1615104 [Ramaria rubella]